MNNNCISKIIDIKRCNHNASCLHQIMKMFSFTFYLIFVLFLFIISEKAKDVSWKLHLLAKYSNKLTRSKSEEIHVMLFVYWKENWCSTICFTNLIMILFSSFSYISWLYHHFLITLITFFRHKLKHPYAKL